MGPSRRFGVRFAVCVLTAGVLAAAVPTAALAASSNSATKAALATERYLSSYGDHHSVATDDAAVAAEHYLSSYGTPHTLAPPAPAAADTVSSTGPSWTAAILAVIGSAFAAGIAGIAGGRAIARAKRVSA